MKRFKFIIIPLLVFFITLFGCEKDDICSETTETTPKMHIVFYDITLPSENIPKNVNRLRVTGVGNPDILSNYDGSKAQKEVSLPLKTTENNTQYVLHRGYNIDENDNVLGNPDTITINYARKEVFVSRACGYKTIFENVVVTVEDDGNKWIQLTQAVTDNQTVENEADIHYKIYL